MTPEIAGAKRKLELQATSPGVPNWARQLLSYIEQLEEENSKLKADLDDWLNRHEIGE